jgi:malate dehydrogenase (oxaloacetate-decarboxylating)(NADP+)
MKVYLMYDKTFDGDDIVVRFNKDEAKRGEVAKLLESLEGGRGAAKTGNIVDSTAVGSLQPKFPTGIQLLRDPALNKGTAFTEEERASLGLLGLLPPRVHTMEEQLARVLRNVRRKPTDLDRYIFLVNLQDRNRTLFYRLLLDNIEELTPIVYTPTVGQACLEYSSIYRRPRGLYITASDKGRIKELLRNSPFEEIRVIVVTDGERILGLGDIGADGMGIPLGKLALYTACAGVHPTLTLPVCIDVGTENEALLSDPLYIGLRHRRLRGKEYDDLIEEFVRSVQHVFPGALIQFEDFANVNAFRLLRKYQLQVCCFNDDIQGTAAVTLAGLFSAFRITRQDLKDQTFLFLGAGEAGLGAGDLIVSAMVHGGLSADEARKRCWFFDSKGLLVKGRGDMTGHKSLYAHEQEFESDFVAAIERIRPTAIIGVSGKQGMFTQPVIEAMARINERPIVFSLSNPTAKTECTAEDAYAWSGGRAVFASGSPFDPVIVHGRMFTPAQGNNVYIFPGIGLGVMASWARYVTDEMFLVAARTLAQQVSDADLEQGRVYPPLSRIREASAIIATQVAEIAYIRGLSSRPRPHDLASYVRSLMYLPEYESYV